MSSTEETKIPELTNSEMESLLSCFCKEDDFYSLEFLNNLDDKYMLGTREEAVVCILTALRLKKLGSYDEQHLFDWLADLNDDSLACMFLHYCV